MNGGKSRLRRSWLGIDPVRLASKERREADCQYRRDGPFAEVIGSTGQYPVLLNL
jgi:hypothetical protein